jgi:hypothetical protein
MSTKRKVIPFPAYPSKYTITRWKLSHHWAVLKGEELIALCVYRKGARSVVTHLDERDALKRQLRGLRFLDNVVADPSTANERR